MQHIKDKIKKVFKDNFLRYLSDEEVDVFFETMLSTSRSKFSKIEGFTEEKFQRYLQAEKHSNSDLEVVFSPLSIETEIVRIINEIGLEALEKSSKYKRLYEMVNAVCLCLAIKKISGEEWMIKPQDNPDILLIRTNNNRFNEKPIDAAPLEIMQIPEEVLKSFNNDIENKVAEFIKEKKFNKRYGNEAHLLVHLNFNLMGFNLKKLSERLKSFSNNPFHQIWTRANTDPSSSTMNISQVYPNFSAVEIDFIKEKNLYY